MDSKTNKVKAGILGYFQPNCRPSPAENQNNVHGVKGTGIEEGQDISSPPEINKENNSKLVVKMKPRGPKKKRKKGDLEEISTDEELDEILNCKKKKIRVSPSEVPRKDTPNLSDVEPKKSTSPESGNPKKSISLFFKKVTKEERLEKIEKDNSLVEVKAIVHESPEDKKSNETKKKIVKSKKLSNKARKSNVSISAAETENIELLEVDDIVENADGEKNAEDNVGEGGDVLEMELDADENLKEGTRKISTNLFKSKDKKVKGENIEKNCKNEDSDDSVNMESLENSPVKNLPSASNSPIKKAARVDQIDQEDSKPNAFDTLMKNSRKSTEGQVTAPCVVSKTPQDETLKKMLSALQSVESDGEACDLEVRNIVSSNKRRKRKKRKVKKEDADDGFSDSEDVFQVRCRNTQGKFHLSKFSCTGTNQCIQINETWMTPNDFETFSGSRAKKYKVSLSINNQPLGEFLEDRNIRTPSRSQSRGGRSTPQSRNSGNSTPAIDDDVTTNRTARKPKSITEDSEDQKVGEDGNEASVISLTGTPSKCDILGTKKQTPLLRSDSLPRPSPCDDSKHPESPLAGRRSGRIAKKATLFDEKKRIQEEQERQLEESDKKVELERKIRNAAVAKQKKLLARRGSQSLDPSVSDCQIEEIVNSPSRKKKEKVASIFMKQKKPVKPVEDQAVVAARKAFLMSSAPETLRTRICVEGEEKREEAGVVWPGPRSLPSHTGRGQSSLTSRPAACSLTDERLFSHKPSQSPPRILKVTPEDGTKSCDRQVVRMDEASVLATVKTLAEGKSFPSVRMFNSLVERKVEAEMFEREAREKNLSMSEVEEKRIRGNRRRSRRSLELKAETEAGRYQVCGQSGLLWTSKYQPRCGADIVGHTAEVADLRTWLNTWARVGRAKHNSDLTSDDNPTDSEYEVDMESVDIESQSNVALLVGPSGSGKTAMVFALAAELGFKVLEVNASSNRTGKQILSMLSEATKSQQVRRQEENKRSFFSKKAPEETNAGSKKMKMALILLEDIDLIHEDLDEGFYSAVNTLSQTSKRPIVMTVSNNTWFIEGCGTLGEKVLKFLPKEFYISSVSKENLARHLQTVAMVEGYHIDRSDLKSKVMNKRCGVRGALLQLQLYCSSGLDKVEASKEDVEDEETEDSAVDMQWFSHIDSKTLRKGLVSSAGGVTTDLASAWKYDTVAWWESLPGTKSAPKRLRRYPLTQQDKSSSQFKRIDPLRNRELFDTEESGGEDEAGNEEREKSGQEQPVLVSREERETNYKSLSALSAHLELVSEWSQEQDLTPFHVTYPHPGGGMSQDLAELRSQAEDRQEVEAEYSRLLLSLSADLVKNSEVVARSHSDMQLLHPDWRDENFFNLSELKREAFTTGLVDIFLTDRMSKLDLMAGIRTLARGEEVRRLHSSEDRRGCRFRHYFAQNEVVMQEETLSYLCNALID